MDYKEFIKRKKISSVPTGIEDIDSVSLNELLFDFQKAIVKWALRRGRSCIWADCGLGKTAMQLEWSRVVCEHTRKPVLIITPLAVSEQTAMIEGPKFGISCKIVSSSNEVSDGINITNYEKLEKFDLSQFGGVVLDESSILKNYAGKTRNIILEKTSSVQFKLACTATPAQNDYMELGNHAEFIGAMKYNEMLSMFFIHDGGETAKWRLKGHAKKDFFSWVASWAVFIRKPSDIGFDDSGFVLPQITFHEVTVATNPAADKLFPVEATDLYSRQIARRETVSERVEAAVKIIEANKESQEDKFCVWCNLNDEAEGVAKKRPVMVNIQGSDSNEKKASAMLEFATGKISEIVTKPKIAGFGMNWQNCCKVIFLGLSDSYEQYYQAVRRFYRFGQKNTVHVWIVTADIEGGVVENIKRKERDANGMYEEMMKYMNVENRSNLNTGIKPKSVYNPSQKIRIPKFLAGAI